MYLMGKTCASNTVAHLMTHRITTGWIILTDHLSLYNLILRLLSYSLDLIRFKIE